MAQVAQVRGLNGKGNCLRNTAGSRTEQNAGIPQRAGHEESEEEKTQRNTAKSRTRNGGREETAEDRREQNRNGGIPPNAGQNRRNTGENRTERKTDGRKRAK